MAFAEDIRFDRLGAFCYSAEDDTPQCHAPIRCREEVKQQRLDRLMTAQQAHLRSKAPGCASAAGSACWWRAWTWTGMAVARSAAEAPETDGVIRVSGACEADIGCFVGADLAPIPADLTGKLNWPNRLSILRIALVPLSADGLC